ncbi:MAG: hypothetical protein JST80_12540 [Bdellovibrionales bacterium]|nr:hypothetical protein [Bdellovibrionales bacterium]
MKNSIHTFSVQGEITSQDAKVLRTSLFTFLETNPLFLVVDLSQATLMIPDAEIHSILSEVRTLASAKNLSLAVAQSDFESLSAPKLVVEAALEKHVRILESKLELREKVKEQIKQLTEENKELKEKVKRSPHSISPFVFFEKIWSSLK